MRDIEIDRALGLQKQRANHHLLLGEYMGEIVFSLWVVMGTKSLMNRLVDLGQGGITIERGFTHPQYRGHGLFVNGLNFLVPQMKAARAHCCLTEIASHNLTMVRTTLKCGFTRTDSSFLLLVSINFANCRRVRSLARSRDDPLLRSLAEFTTACRISLDILLFAGLFGHNLTRFNWLWLTAFGVWDLSFAPQMPRAAALAGIEDDQK